MVYSTSDRAQESLTEARADRAGRAILQAEGRRLVIAPGGAVVGRSRECDVVLGEETVSRFHAELRHDADAWMIRDLDSTNGTWLNGARVDEARVLGGDELWLGGLRVELRL
jgi:pSer/pThr/pTyr-binding forkhead associated (FHA) protein